MAKSGSSAKSSPSRVTPLWIVAAFVTLTETVLGYALTQVSGGVQIALTSFVIVFALLVAGAFFFILWSRPYVFYSPAEYGTTDPKHFVDAMKGILPDRVADQIAEAKANPEDDSAQFALMDSLLDDAIRQHLILMRDKNLSIPVTDFWGPPFETGAADRSWMTGVISGREIAKKLAGSGLVIIEPKGPSVQLTDLGSKFADWLVATGKRNEFYSSQLGGWGAPKRPEGLPPQFFEGAGFPTPRKPQAPGYPGPDRNGGQSADQGPPVNRSTDQEKGSGV